MPALGIQRSCSLRVRSGDATTNKMASSHICSCFGNLRPRYKRLVDNIFPADPRDGLVKANMDKLIFYALSSPEKLDRIGAYLARKLTRDVDRRRSGFVFIDVEALDQILLACRAPNLNQFVESFLKMVQKLLESTEVDLQVLGSTSFVKFADIEEDTPSYHRRYDFFVSKFSAMCWNNADDKKDRTRVRSAGLKGLQGVVRKTVSDDLQVNIWDPSHMGKIIPSLLFVLETGEKDQHLEAVAISEGNSTEDDPATVAESCLRELISRASFGHIKSFINPLLSHFDNCKLWVPNDFALKISKIILYSVQNQYNYIVIEMLLNHLDKHSQEPATVKASIVQVLAACVEVASSSSIGPAVLEVFNTLLRHLRSSVHTRFGSRKSSKSTTDDEVKFEESLVGTVGAFAAVLPDFQKTDIMLFIMGKFPLSSSEIQNSETLTVQSSHRKNSFVSESDAVLQKMLLHCLLKVAQSFTSVSLSATFSPSFLDALLQATIVSDPAGRNLAQEILHTLIDRHANHPKLGLSGMLGSVQEVELTVESCSKQDLIFFKKNKGQILWYLFEYACMVSNSVENILSLYLTLAVLSTELNDIEVISYLIQFVFGLQTAALKEDKRLQSTNRCALHGLVAAYLRLVAKLLQTQDLQRHVSQVLKLREKEATYLMPEKTLKPNTGIQLSSHNIPKKLLFDYTQVHKALVHAGCDAKALKSPYEHQPLAEVMAHSLASSPVESSANHDIDSSDTHPTTSPGIHPPSPKEHITFQMLKEIIAEKSHKNAQHTTDEVEFNQASFAEIADTVSTKAQEFQSKLSNIMEGLSTPVTTKSLSVSQLSLSSIPGDETYELKFPTQYVY